MMITPVRPPMAVPGVFSSRRVGNEIVKRGGSWDYRRICAMRHPFLG